MSPVFMNASVVRDASTLTLTPPLTTIFLSETAPSNLLDQVVKPANQHANQQRGERAHDGMNAGVSPDDLDEQLWSNDDWREALLWRRRLRPLHLR
jgi:hypothetical protein